MEPSTFANTAPPVQPGATLTVIETVYYQVDGEDAVCHETKYCQRIKSGEQPYVRHLKLGKQWQPLDHGWLQHCSLLVIENKALNRTTTLTDEEKQEDQQRLVELAFQEQTNPYVPIEPQTSGVLFLPGKGVRITPRDLECIYLRAPYAPATAVLRLYPADEVDNG